jgi:hypothetical protein
METNEKIWKVHSFHTGSNDIIPASDPDKAEEIFRAEMAEAGEEDQGRWEDVDATDVLDEFDVDDIVQRLEMSGEFPLIAWAEKVIRRELQKQVVG